MGSCFVSELRVCCQLLLTEFLAAFTSTQNPFLPFELTNLKMAKELSEETLKEAFESADKDKDSQISVSELGKIVKELFGADEGDFKMMLGLVKLDFQTFKAFCEKIKLVSLMNEDTTEAKKGIFKMMDKDGDGTLSKKEFKRMMKQYLEVNEMFGGCDDSDDSDDETAGFNRFVKEKFKKLDINGDGVLNFEEIEKEEI